jgi:hypothetical protein
MIWRYRQALARQQYETHSRTAEVLNDLEDRLKLRADQRDRVLSFCEIFFGRRCAFCASICTTLLDFGHNCILRTYRPVPLLKLFTQQRVAVGRKSRETLEEG